MVDLKAEYSKFSIYEILLNKFIHCFLCFIDVADDMICVLLNFMSDLIDTGISTNIGGVFCKYNAYRDINKLSQYGKSSIAFSIFPYFSFVCIVFIVSVLLLMLSSLIFVSVLFIPFFA